MEGVVFPAMTPRQEAEAVKETEKSERERESQEGDKVYLVSNRWFTEWCQHTGFAYDAARKRMTVSDLSSPGPRPGPVDSSDLVEPAEAAPGREPDLSEAERAALVRLKARPPPYFEVREPTWDLLKRWYGVTGPEVCVEYMQVGPARGSIELEAHPWHIKAVLEASEAEHTNCSAIVPISSACTVANLKRRCCEKLGVKEGDYEIFDFYGMEKATKLEHNLFKRLQAATIMDLQAVMLRHKDRVKEVEEEEREAAALAVSPPAPLLLSTSPGSYMGTSPVPSSPLSRSMSKPPSWAEDLVQTSASRRRGLAGLGNLGNTCFMNSSVQCLAHTVPVMETFLSGAYKADINTDNPLGQGGKLATCFGGLMEKLWQGGVSSVSPKRFKWQLARFAPQFQGYAQQDSQELLAFLLDGLHEDLNRIKNKPYIEEKDDDGRPDGDLAQDAWTNYRARNDSVIVDNFQGLFKSTLVCPRCKHKSRKFDPFMYLTLPLPTAKTRAFSIVVVSMDGSQPPTQYSVEVPKTATIRQLLGALAKVCGACEGGAAPEDMLLLAQYSPASYSTNKTELLTELEARVSAIKEPGRGFFASSKTVLLAYRYPDAASGPRAPGKKLVLVAHKFHGANAAVPSTPLFLGEEQLAALRLEPGKAYSSFSSSLEWAVAEPGSVLDSAVKRLLRPFRRFPEPAEAAECAAPAGDSNEAMQGVAGPGAEGSGESPGGPRSAAGGAFFEVPGAEAMELEQPDTPRPESLAGPSPSASSGGSNAAADEQEGSSSMALDAPGADGGAAAAFIGPLPPPAASPGEPFNMWPQQEAAAAAASAGPSSAEAAAAAQACQQPYHLKLAAGPDCRPRTVFGPEPQVAPDMVAEAAPLYFLAEWSKEGAAAYDPVVLDRPAKHQLALDAEAAASARGERGVTLAECMESFLQPEQLDAEDSWYCAQCKEHVQADKKLDLWSLPEVLVVHLKRFSYSRYSRDKLDTRVSFPLEGLDLTKYLLAGDRGQQAATAGAAEQGSSCVYDLFAVSNHYGGLGGGHYTAYCKMPDDGQWYLFDDSSVRPEPADQVVSPAAYVLFYRRKGSKVNLGALFSPQEQQPGAQASEQPLDGQQDSELQFAFGSPP